jgi:hypothetical protein
MKIRLTTITEAEAGIHHLAINLQKAIEFKEHVLEVLHEQSRRRLDDPMYESADGFLAEECRKSPLKRSMGLPN